MRRLSALLFCFVSKKDIITSVCDPHFPPINSPINPLKLLHMAGAGTADNRTLLVPIQPGVTRVGWIGTGAMGAAMASRVLSSGYPLSVYARDPSKPLVRSLLAAGAIHCPTPADLARASDVVFTMVGHPSDVRSVILHPATGVLSSLPPGSAVVDTTTSLPDLARQIASASSSRGCHAVDAPVSGGDIGARDGKLTILAGADDEEVVRWLSPLFGVIGTKVTYMGPAGSGQSAKIANQIAVSGSMLGLTEAVVFAERSGLDPKAFLDAIRGGAAGSKTMELYGDRIVGRRDLTPGAFAEYLVKDLGMALDASPDVAGASPAAASALPGTALFQQMYLAMVASGDGRRLGSHALISVIDRINNSAGATPNDEQQQDPC